eukprot:9315803-Pyramimonas_sp.AAC.2
MCATSLTGLLFDGYCCTVTLTTDGLSSELRYKVEKREAGGRQRMLDQLLALLAPVTDCD